MDQAEAENTIVHEDLVNMSGRVEESFQTRESSLYRFLASKEMAARIAGCWGY